MLIILLLCSQIAMYNTTRTSYRTLAERSRFLSARPLCCCPPSAVRPLPLPVGTASEEHAAFRPPESRSPSCRSTGSGGGPATQHGAVADLNRRPQPRLQPHHLRRHGGGRARREEAFGHETATHLLRKPRGRLEGRGPRSCCQEVKVDGRGRVVIVDGAGEGR